MKLPDKRISVIAEQVIDDFICPDQDDIEKAINQALDEQIEAIADREAVIAKAFFRWWWNQDGQNTDQGWEEFTKTDEYDQLRKGEG